MGVEAKEPNMTALPGRVKPKTRAEEVRVTVRRDILRGHLQPGEKLSPSALAQEYGVSLSVVREALTSLAEQGLVVSQPQLGFQVTPISRADLLDLTSVRLDIETLALRRSVLQGDVEWRTALVAAHYRLEHTPQTEPDVEPFAMNEDWAMAHKVFHDQLLSACGSRRLLEIAESLRDAADLYRRWSVPIGGDQDRDVVSEHRAIFDAAQEGDADLAVEQLSRHISHTTNVLLKRAT
jgi:DNA-binding GntR family transcriptional regulator